MTCSPFREAYVPSYMVSLIKSEAHNLVDLVGCSQGLALSGDDALLGGPFHVEHHVAIHPMHSFVIPRLVVFTQPIKAFDQHRVIATLEST